MQQQRTGRPTQTPNSLSASLSLSPSLSVFISLCLCVTICNKSLRHECNSQPSERPQSVAHTHTHSATPTGQPQRTPNALLSCIVNMLQRRALKGTAGKGDGGGKGHSLQQQSFIGASLSRSSSSSTLSTRRLTTGERCSEGVRPLHLLTPLARPLPLPLPLLLLLLLVTAADKVVSQIY